MGLASEVSPQVRSVLHAFGVVPTRVTAHFGNTTSVGRVDTDGPSFVLRRRAAREADHLGTTHHLLRYLAPLAIAPEVHAAPNGEEIVVADDAIYELLAFLPGEVSVTGWDFEWDDDTLLASAAELLARLNVALRDYAPPSSSKWYERTTMPRRAELKTHLRSQNNEETRAILDALGLVEAHLRPPPEDRTRRHVVHNDFAWYNLVRSDRTATGVIDFDSAQPNTELHDIAYAVYAFAPINEAIAGRSRSPSRTAERIATFLRPYEERAGRLPLSAASLLDMAAHRVALSAASLLGGLVHGEARAQRLPSHTVGYVTWLGWYQRQRRDLIEAVAAALPGQ